MSSENRFLPNSQKTRMKALDDAFAKDVATGSAILTGLTRGRMITIRVQFRTSYDAIYPFKQALAILSVQKESYDKVLQMVCSHFIQVFNLGVVRGVFTEADRVFYKLDITGNTLPEMSKDSDLIQVAKNLIKGEADRVAAGGTPMAMPSIGDVQAAFNNFNNTLILHSNATDDLDLAQEALEVLNDEADKVIKKIWDEIETYYNEEDAASQRQNCRQWGIVYVLRGSNKKVTGRVVRLSDNQPITGAKVYFENGKGSVLSDAQGFFELTTTLMSDQNMIAEKDIFQLTTTAVTLVENEDLEGVEIKMASI